MLETIWGENWARLSSHLMGWGRIVLVVVGIVLCIGILHKKLEENEAIRLVVLGGFLFLSEYIIISAVLFQVDGWGITTTLLIEVVINGALYEMMSFRKEKSRTRRGLNLAFKPYLPLACVCLAALLISCNSHGYYGMQQDQGVYQTSAIAMIYGNGNNQKELTVYQKLPEEDRERYMQVVPTAINGFYFYDEELEGLYQGEFTSDAAGYFHGIPTYPALLALWGGMFGFQAMAGIQNVIFVMLLAIGYFFLSDLGCKKGTAALGCGIVAVSPMILWVAQSALTEMYLACALMAFLYFLSKEDRAAVWLSAIAIISFGCIHLSLYTLMPVVVLIYAGLAVRYRRRTYIAAGMLTTAGFWFATNMTRMISTEYFYLNVEPLLWLFPWLNRENVMGFITIVCVVVVGAGIVAILLFSKFCRAGQGKRRSCYWCGWLMRALVVIWCILVVVMAVQTGKRGGDWQASSALGYCVLAGVVMLPLGLAGILAKPQMLWKDRASALLGALFAYCILIYCLAFRREIVYYYYYGRYLVPFIPLVVLQGMQTLLMLKGRIRWVVCGIVAAAQIIFLPYDLVLATQKDDTRLEWEVLEELADCIKPNDVLIIEDALLNICYLPLTYMLQADVLPQMQYPPINVMCRYASQGGDTYYLSSGRAEIGQTFTVLRSSYTASEDEQNTKKDQSAEDGRDVETDKSAEDGQGTEAGQSVGDEQDEDGGILGLPMRMTGKTGYLQLDRLAHAKDVYTAEDDGWINMFIDENGFRHGNGSEYGLTVYLAVGDYQVHLQQGTAIPLEIYGVEYYPVQAYVNGVHLQELRFYQEKGTEEIVFDLPASYLKAGENIILFRGEPWKPRDFGKDDYRELGINLSEIRFEKR